MSSNRKKVLFWGLVAISVVVIAYFGLSPGNGARAPETAIQSPATQTPRANQAQPNTSSSNTAGKPVTGGSQPGAGSTANQGKSDAAIKIVKNQVNSNARFYPLNLDGVNMEVIAVKATDDTVRTALNTCQVCFDSGRGYYIQEGDYLVCQNCGNRFHIDQVEKIKGGCNPVPILEADKKDTGESITISTDYMLDQKPYFSRWKT